MLRLVISILLGLFLVLPPQNGSARTESQTGIETPGPIEPLTRLVMHSESGDFVGAGQDYVYTPVNGAFSAQANDFTGDGLADNVVISFLGFLPGQLFEFWHLTFSTSELGTNLTPGIYNRARRASFAPPGFPGLDVGGNGRGCNGVSGKFIVLDAQFDYSQPESRLISFAARFEQHCEGLARALFGNIYFNYSPPVTVALDQTTLTGGETVGGTVSLRTPAPKGGVLVELTSSNSPLVSVPSMVLIKPGQTRARFTAESHVIKARPSVSIIASFQGISSEATLSVLSPLPSLTRLSAHRDAGPFNEEFNRMFTEGDGGFFATINFTENDVSDTITIAFEGPGAGHNVLDFSTTQLGIPLQPGFYPHTQPIFGTEPGRAGMDVSCEDVPCRGSVGDFTIVDINVDDTFSPAQVISFAATFRLDCGFAPLTIGDILINFSGDLPPVGFNLCLQDDSTGDVMKINSTTGAYQVTLCRDGAVLTGTGIVTVKGNVIALRHDGSDRRVTARVDVGANRATASIQVFSQGSTITILDWNTGDSPCRCPSND